MRHAELIDYLDSDNNHHGLDSVTTHGFLSALVVGQPLDDWQSIYFEGQQDVVPIDIRQALSAWLDNLRHSMQQEHCIELDFLALLDEDEEVDFSTDSDLSAWSVGFVDVMYASENADLNWFVDDEQSDDVAMLTLPMMVFAGADITYDEQGNAAQDEQFAKLRQDDTALAQMANSIETNLTELYLLFHIQE